MLFIYTPGQVSGISGMELEWNNKIRIQNNARNSRVNRVGKNSRSGNQLH